MTCAIDGCENIAKTRGWCIAHYRRWLKYDDPEGGGPLRHRGTPEERFWAKLKTSDDCWEWQGARNNKGYGILMLKEPGKKHVARTTHRFSWELHNGPIPNGLWVLHRCDNPPCANPAHLFLGDNADNIRDMWAKGRRDRASVLSRNTQTELA